MKTIILLLIILFASPALADFKDWDNDRKQIFIAYNVISVIDIMQTHSALNDPCNCYIEANPVLGSNPSTEKMILLNAIGSYALYRILDNPANDLLPAKIVTGIRLGVIVHNHSLGARIQFKF